MASAASETSGEVTAATGGLACYMCDVSHLVSDSNEAKATMGVHKMEYVQVKKS